MQVLIVEDERRIATALKRGLEADGFSVDVALHANEILLIAYYIAAINIEATYHDLTDDDYQPFPGFVYTDTFQMVQDASTLDVFGNSSERARKQQWNPGGKSGQRSQKAAVRLLTPRDPHDYRETERVRVIETPFSAWGAGR